MGLEVSGLIGAVRTTTVIGAFRALRSGEASTYRLEVRSGLFFLPMLAMLALLALLCVALRSAFRVRKPEV